MCQEEYSQLITNSVTIFIALIAGMIALYQVKSNIIASSRINWIENLRETISSYCMEIENCCLAKINLHDERKGKTGLELEKVLDKFYQPYVESSREVDKLSKKALLYLNSKEDVHKKIEDLINQNINLVHDKKNDNRNEIQKNIIEIINLSKKVFKIEWEKSKKIFKI